MHGVPIANGANLTVSTAAERPQLWEHAEASFPVVWQEYEPHGDVSGQYFSAVFRNAPMCRFSSTTPSGAGGRSRQGHSLPLGDGPLEDLPAGIDAVGPRALNEPAAPTALPALAAEVVPTNGSEG